MRGIFHYWYFAAVSLACGQSIQGFRGRREFMEVTMKDLPVILGESIMAMEMGNIDQCVVHRQFTPDTR